MAKLWEWLVFSIVWYTYTVKTVNFILGLFSLLFTWSHCFIRTQWMYLATCCSPFTAYIYIIYLKKDLTKPCPAARQCLKRFIAITSWTKRWDLRHFQFHTVGFGFVLSYRKAGMYTTVYLNEMYAPNQVCGIIQIQINQYDATSSFCGVAGLCFCGWSTNIFPQHVICNQQLYIWGRISTQQLPTSLTDVKMQLQIQQVPN